MQIRFFTVAASLLLVAGCGDRVLDVDDDGAVDRPVDEDAAPDPEVDPGDEKVPPCPAGALDTITALVDALEAELSSRGVPGGAVAIVCGGETVIARGLGVTKAGGDAVTADTRFQIASATKMFTAAAAVVLAEDGLVDLDAPASTVLGDVAYGDATLRELLSHSAGFPTGFDNYHPDLGPLVDANAGMQLWAAPGAVWNYSNPGFSVAGRILEIAAGMSFAELIDLYLLAPAGLSATMDMAEVAAGPYAYGHSDDEWYGTGPLGPYDAYYHTGYYGPMGGLWASAADLARWARLHIDDGAGAVPAAVFSAIRTPHSATTYGSHYGLGLFIEDAFSPVVFRHSGGVPGFLTEWQVVPEAGFAVALTINSDAYFPESFASDARFAVVDADWTAPTRSEGPDAWPLYLGRYQDPHVFGTVDVLEEGGELELVFVDSGARAPLTWWYGDAYESTFQGEWIDVNFWRVDDESPATHIVSMYGIAARGE